MNRMLQFATEPTKFGTDMANGFFDQLASRVIDGLISTVDIVALAIALGGCFLYMFGIKEGGKYTWLSLALWLFIRIVLLV